MGKPWIWCNASMISLFLFFLSQSICSLHFSCFEVSSGLLYLPVRIKSTLRPCGISIFPSLLRSYPHLALTNACMPIVSPLSISRVLPIKSVSLSEGVRGWEGMREETAPNSPLSRSSSLIRELTRESERANGKRPSQPSRDRWLGKYWIGFLVYLGSRVERSGSALQRSRRPFPSFSSSSSWRREYALPYLGNRQCRDPERRGARKGRRGQQSRYRSWTRNPTG